MHAPDWKPSALGYAAAYRRARVRQEQVPLVFAFEMPLMNVVYLLIPLLWLGGLSILTAVLRDFITGPLSSVLEASLFTGAALYGAVIYRLQLAAVKRLKALE